MSPPFLFGNSGLLAASALCQPSLEGRRVVLRCSPDWEAEHPAEECPPRGELRGTYVFQGLALRDTLAEPDAVQAAGWHGQSTDYS